MCEQRYNVDQSMSLEAFADQALLTASI